MQRGWHAIACAVGVATAVSSLACRSEASTTTPTPRAQPTEPAPAPARTEAIAPPAEARDPVVESTFVLLLSPKRFRAMPYADRAIDLFSPLPDFRLLIERGGLDVLHDFEHILAATPDFRDFRRTFLVAEYTLSRADMQAALERAVRRTGQTIAWVEKDGYVGGNPVPVDPMLEDRDPRWFVLYPDEKIGVYVPPEFLASVVPRGASEARADHVATLRRLVAQHPDAALQLEVEGVSQRTQGWTVPLVPVPLHTLDGVHVSVQAATEPDIAATLAFRDTASAEAIETFWRTDVPKLVQNLDFATRLFVAPLVAQTQVTRDTATIVAKARLTEPQLVWVVDLCSSAVRAVSGRSAQEMEQLRLQHQDNWRRRGSGRLPPATLGD